MHQQVLLHRAQNDGALPTRARGEIGLEGLLKITLLEVPALRQNYRLQTRIINTNPLRLWSRGGIRFNV